MTVLQEDPPVPAPALPPGRTVELPGRGTTFMRECSGPADSDALPIVLLHGWTATADLNWFACYEALGAHQRVIALDHRGHGHGIRARKPFTLEDCADDAVALCDELGIGEFIAVGYSMGGPVALTTWRRHRDRVTGLVLCATAPYFSASREERRNFRGLGGLAALSRATPVRAQRWLTEQLYLQRRATKWEPWAIQQVSHHDWRMILEAGRALGSFSAREWLGEIDVPVSVITTMRDEIVPLRRQIRLFEEIPGAQVFRVDGGHDAVVARSDAFNPALQSAIDSVRARR